MFQHQFHQSEIPSTIVSKFSSILKPTLEAGTKQCILIVCLLITGNEIIFLSSAKIFFVKIMSFNEVIKSSENLLSYLLLVDLSIIYFVS